MGKEERKRKLEVQLEFAPEDIALATVPGLEFDPKTRTFDMEELRPQPIIKKRKKNAVPEEHKDEKYWEKRLKNKEATRRSREAKRLKQNKNLKEQIESAKKTSTELAQETDELKARLRAFE